MADLIFVSGKMRIFNRGFWETYSYGNNDDTPPKSYVLDKSNTMRLRKDDMWRTSLACLEHIIGEYLDDHGRKMHFLTTHTCTYKQSTDHKGKVDKFNYIKIMTIYPKYQKTEWKE